MGKRAKCVRRNCNKKVIKKSGTRRLCSEHFALFQSNQDRYYTIAQPEEQPQRVCAHCKKTINNKKNKKYCSTECSYHAQRIIDDDFVTLLNNHTWFQTVTMMLRRSPWGIASVSGPKGIVSLIQSCAEVARFQRSFATTAMDSKTGEIVKRLTPRMSVQLGHRYPAAAGGGNYRRALTKTPALINRKLQARVYGPVSPWGERHFGKIIQLEEEKRPLKTRLLRQLAQQYPAQELIAILKRAEPALQYAGKSSDKPLPAEPLLHMLVHELSQYGPKTCLLGLRDVLLRTPSIPGGWREILAVACFIALQTQDADGLLEELAVSPFRRTFPLRLNHGQREEDELNHGYTQQRYFLYGSFICDILSKAEKAIQRCFGITMFTEPQKMNVIYRSMFHVVPDEFSLPPLELVLQSDPRHPAKHTD